MCYTRRLPSNSKYTEIVQEGCSEILGIVKEDLPNFKDFAGRQPPILEF